MLQHLGNVIGTENRVEHKGEERNGPTWKILECHVLSTVLARSLADLQTPDGSVTSSGVVSCVSLAGLRSKT